MEYAMEYAMEYPVECPMEYSMEYPVEYPVEYPMEYPMEYSMEYPVEYPMELACTNGTVKQKFSNSIAVVPATTALWYPTHMVDTFRGGEAVASSAWHINEMGPPYCSDV